MMRFLLPAIAVIMVGCDKLISLEPNEVVRSADVKTEALKVDSVLSNIASANGVTLNRDQKPRERSIPRDYLATIIVEPCMILFDGQKMGDYVLLEISIHATQGKPCNKKVYDIFDEARRQLGLR